MKMSSALHENLVTLSDRLLKDAALYGIPAARLCTPEQAEAIKAECTRRYQEENAEAIDQHNAWVEKHGLPLAKYRMF
jgi:antitoxin CcdA